MYGWLFFGLLIRDLMDSDVLYQGPAAVQLLGQMCCFGGIVCCSRGKNNMRFPLQDQAGMLTVW